MQFSIIYLLTKDMWSCPIYSCLQLTTQLLERYFLCCETKYQSRLEMYSFDMILFLLFHIVYFQTFLTFFLRKFMIYCEGCQEWFHLDCIGCTTKDVPRKKKKFYCPECKVSQLNQLMSFFKDFRLQAMIIFLHLHCSFPR